MILQNVCNYLPKQFSTRESSVWHYSCLRTSSLYPVPTRPHYRLNQFICNIIILSRGMIQCFSCLNCWIAASERCHHTVSIRCMLLYRVFSPVTYHAMPHTSNVAQSDPITCGCVIHNSAYIWFHFNHFHRCPMRVTQSFWYALPSWLLSLHCVMGLFNPPFATFNPR